MNYSHTTTVFAKEMKGTTESKVVFSDNVSKPKSISTFLEAFIKLYAKKKKKKFFFLEYHLYSSLTDFLGSATSIALVSDPLYGSARAGHTSWKPYLFHSNRKCKIYMTLFTANIAVV